MVDELDTLARLVAFRAAGVRRVRLYPNGALQSADFFALAAGASAPADETPTDRAPPDADDDVSGDASGFRLERRGATWPPRDGQ